MNDKVSSGTFNVVYLREYIDPECESETFAAYETIYRNVPNKYRSKFDNEKMKMKMLKHCDWNYKDSATNFTNVSNIEFKTEKNIILLTMMYLVILAIVRKTKKECGPIMVNVGIDNL